jgi:O-6-methylguanine DNA methyltransferase
MSQTILRFATIQTPIGGVIIGVVDQRCCLIEFADVVEASNILSALERMYGATAIEGSHPIIEELNYQLTEYFDGCRRHFSAPIVMRGTPFQMRVWKALQTIPYGQTRTYGQVAFSIANRKATQAVGKANAQNRHIIIIPCHRVVRQGQSVGGYAGGARRKEYLLALESKGAYVGVS